MGQESAEQAHFQGALATINAATLDPFVGLDVQRADTEMSILRRQQHPLAALGAVPAERFCPLCPAVAVAVATIVEALLVHSRAHFVGL